MDKNKSTETENLLTQVFTTLRDAGLVRSAQAFSTEYLQRNANWYAYQKHTARGFSFGSAVACLQAVRRTSSALSITQQQVTALQKAECALACYLQQHHAVAEVVTMPS